MNDFELIIKSFNEMLCCCSLTWWFNSAVLTKNSLILVQCLESSQVRVGLMNDTIVTPIDY